MRKTWRASLAATTAALAVLIFASAIPSRAQETGGELEVGYQGSYFDNGAGLQKTSGAAFHYRQFLPSVGLLDASFQGYSDNGGFGSGENYVELQNFLWKGRSWSFRGGDFTVSPYAIANPFNNVFLPYISGRGGRVEMTDSNRTVGIFFGNETLPQGAWIPLRESAPQNNLGMYITQKFGTRLKVGARFTRLSSDPAAIARQPMLFSNAMATQSSNGLTVDSEYLISSHLRVYGELGFSNATAISGARLRDGGPLSLLVGPVWESKRFTLRANYVRQTASYLPIVGYYNGDRTGPYAEGTYRFSSRGSVYGSIAKYSNNLADDPALPRYESKSFSSGASYTLPWNVAVNGQFSHIGLDTTNPGQAAGTSSSNQFSFGVGKSIHRHNLRMNWMTIDSTSTYSTQHQRYMEFSDNFPIKRLMLGATFRWQTQGDVASHSTYFVIGSAQYSHGRFNVYAHIEQGNDLVNRSLFATNSFSNTTIGMNVPLPGGWTLKADAYRNKMVSNLNPESLFVLGGQGISQSIVLSSTNTWLTYFKISRQFHWGRVNGSLTDYAARVRPLYGSVEGFVFEQRMNGKVPAAGVAVELDANTTVLTDDTGRYRFHEVPEGSHEVKISASELAADFNPGDVDDQKVRVEAHGIARGDLNVRRLSSLAGKVNAPEGTSFEGVVIRMEPGGRLTTPREDGSFAFYNLPEGDYQLQLGSDTLPEGLELSGSDSSLVSLRIGAPAPAIQFKVTVKQQEQKPEKLIFDKKINVSSLR